MVVTWYNRVKCNSCSEYIWSEYLEHDIACACNHVELKGTQIIKGSSDPIIEVDFEEAVQNTYIHVEILTIEQWQSQ